MMKKAVLLAAAFVAFGVSAQAAVVIQSELATDVTTATLATVSSTDAINGVSGAFIAGGAFTAAGATNAGTLAALTDGGFAIPATNEGLLQDVDAVEDVVVGSVVYDLGSAVNVDSVAVISAWNDSRVFHHYDIYTTTDATVDGSSTWSLLVAEVTSGSFGAAHPNAGNNDATAITVVSDDAGDLATAVTGIRFDFFNVAHNSVTNTFADTFNGTAGANDGITAANTAPFLREIDVFLAPSNIQEWMLID